MIDERLKKGRGRQRVGLPEEGKGNFLNGLCTRAFAGNKSNWTKKKKQEKRSL
jgi:hypothetical protein